MTDRVIALVLAAGYSKRFGAIKLCAELENGQTVYQQTLTNIRCALDDVLVITRAELAPLLADGHTEIRICSDAQLGMGASLAFGIKQIINDDRWLGCLVCLADMPLIRPQSYGLIAREISAAGIVIPNFQGEPGNPVGFGRNFFASLANLNGDQGGRRIINDHPGTVLPLSLDDPAILLDIDTPDDLMRARRPD